MARRSTRLQSLRRSCSRAIACVSRSPGAMATRPRSAPRACARPAGARGARASASMERSPRRSRRSPSTGWRRSATTRSTSPFPTVMPAKSIHGRPAKDRVSGWPRCDTDCVERGRARAASRRTMQMTSDAKTEVIETDLLVLGGGTGGPMAAIKAKEKNPALRVFSWRRRTSSAAALCP